MASQGRPKIADAQLIETILHLTEAGFSTTQIAIQLELAGWVNTKGNRYARNQIRRLQRRYGKC